jgi:BolA protein
MSIEVSIREKLTRALKPVRLDVINESALHAGHRSAPSTGESHFRVLVVAEAFRGRPRLERHRMINAALADELRRGVHALAIEALAPEEAGRTPR